MEFSEHLCRYLNEHFPDHVLIQFARTVSDQILVNGLTEPNKGRQQTRFKYYCPWTQLSEVWAILAWHSRRMAAPP